MPLVVVNAHTGGECVLKQNPIPFRSGRFWHSLAWWHLQFLIWHCSALVWSDLHTGGVLKQDPIPFSGTKEGRSIIGHGGVGNCQYGTDLILSALEASVRLTDRFIRNETRVMM